jgi:DNA-binding transcriptional LysR family regulator
VLVLRHADAVIARLKAAQADVAAMIEGGAGVLRVGTFQSAGARLLPDLVRTFREEWPRVTVQLIESASDTDLLDYVERGDLDLSFVMPPLPEGPFATLELMRDPWVILVPSDAPLAAREGPIPLREVAELPLIGARLCRSREQVDAHFRSRGLEPRYVFHSDENNTIHGLVAAGAGIALMPGLAVDVNDERVTAIEVGPRVAPRMIALAWHRDRYRSPAAEAFVELATAVAARLHPEQAPAVGV